ncbi:hypothetical protein [Neomegalonema sp.]|uniref:hypothetical protein n=1 Tax=Neomegalonema sp. TaxID=2039713 RepID=UPI00260D4CE6|nr:hypothetical protein [Neomegalonema sp.]MDD2868177.1 hypothetical protein [Neomegalonema sp.]
MNGINGLGGFAPSAQIGGAGAVAPVDPQAQDASAAEGAKFQQALQSQGVKMGTFVMSYIMNDILEQLMKDPNDPSAV